METKDKMSALSNKQSEIETMNICNSWYYVADKGGVLHKRCIWERDCPNDTTSEIICGLYHNSEEPKNEVEVV